LNFFVLFVSRQKGQKQDLLMNAPFEWSNLKPPRQLASRHPSVD